jgi:hypothetical protein
MSAPVRPEMGARMVAYCNWTFAFSMAARCASSVASSAAALVRAVSRCSRDAALHQLIQPLDDDLCVGRLRGIALEIRGGLLQRRLERPAIQREEFLSGLDVVAFLEVDGGEFPRDLGAHRDRGIGFDRADDAGLERHRLAHGGGRGDRHRGRPRPLRLRLGLAARARDRHDHPAHHD